MPATLDPAETVTLRHIIVAAGTVADWAATTDEQFTDRLSELGKVADHVGAGWLVLRPYEGPSAGLPERTHEVTVGHCVVSARWGADGRARIAAAVDELHRTGGELSEASIAELVHAPAGADPDLVVIVGPPHRLPPSLVWELAYSEIVFLDVDWAHLGATHLADAIESFRHRHRRFGGID